MTNLELAKESEEFNLDNIISKLTQNLSKGDDVNKCSEHFEEFLKDINKNDVSIYALRKNKDFSSCVIHFFNVLKNSHTYKEPIETKSISTFYKLAKDYWNLGLIESLDDKQENYNLTEKCFNSLRIQTHENLFEFNKSDIINLISIINFQDDISYSAKNSKVILNHIRDILNERSDDINLEDFISKDEAIEIAEFCHLNSTFFNDKKDKEILNVVYKDGIDEELHYLNRYLENWKMPSEELIKKIEDYVKNCNKNIDSFKSHEAFQTCALLTRFDKHRNNEVFSQYIETFINNIGSESKNTASEYLKYCLEHGIRLNKNSGMILLDKCYDEMPTHVASNKVYEATLNLIYPSAELAQKLTADALKTDGYNNTKIKLLKAICRTNAFHNDKNNDFKKLGLELVDKIELGINSFKNEQLSEEKMSTFLLSYQRSKKSLGLEVSQEEMIKQKVTLNEFYEKMFKVNYFNKLSANKYRKLLPQILGCEFNYFSEETIGMVNAKISLNAGKSTKDYYVYLKDLRQSNGAIESGEDILKDYIAKKQKINVVRIVIDSRIMGPKTVSEKMKDAIDFIFKDSVNRYLNNHKKENESKQPSPEISDNLDVTEASRINKKNGKVRFF